ncbi:MAG: TAXI family TRAP transporter solute-binding subunit [Candidatus Methanomethylicaceae archaeon]
MKRVSGPFCIVTCIIICSLVILGMAGSAGAQQRFELKWGTITAGGAWQIIGAAMLEDVKKAYPNITGSTFPSTTAANAIGVQTGKFNIAFCLTDTVAEAWEGKGEFEKYGKMQDLRALVALYPHSTHIVVREDSGIRKIEDLRGKRISPDGKGLSCDLQTQRLLAIYGMSYKDVRVSFLSFSDAAQNFIDGHLDALTFMTVPHPFSPVIQVANQAKIRLLSLEEKAVRELTKFRGVERFTLPAGLYKGVDYPVQGIAVRSFVIVHKDLPEEIAYKVTRSICENLSRYYDVLACMKNVKQEDLARDVGIPYHQGALKYFGEKGLKR